MEEEDYIDIKRALDRIDIKLDNLHLGMDIIMEYLRNPTEDNEGTITDLVTIRKKEEEQI